MSNITGNQLKATNILYSKNANIKKQLCLGNTSYLIEQMRNTQRQMNSFIQQEFLEPYKRWKNLHPLFESAMSGFRFMLQPFELMNKDETKYFLEFINPNASCNFVTLGVGKDWTIEKAMRQKYPQCHFMGVDPVKENREIVEAEPNSLFVLGAVSDTIGNESAYILDDKYVDRKISHRAFVELLATENKGKLIDFLSIDIEGPEFGLLKELHNQRAKLPTICQINVEIHYGLDGQKNTMGEHI
ncbi:Methyltransf-21 domain-containing protein [Aphelenchoides besseyi]|nr:Methyltransf-21 domain-containing protein [Aphelenchoides besseyi]